MVARVTTSWSPMAAAPPRSASSRRKASPATVAPSRSTSPAISAASRAKPGFRVTKVRTYEGILQAQTVRERLLAMLAVFFAAVALLLAGVGLYGVLDYSVFQRRREIGIRMALGAGKRDIFRQVLGRGLHFAGLGLVLGLMISLAFTRYLRGMLYGVGTTDWLTFVMGAILLCVATLIACFVPARRAASTDPIQALRTE